MDRPLYLVAYDGLDRHVIAQGVAMAKTANADLLVVHVLHWSPYAFLTNEELAARHKAREAELERAWSAVLDPILADLAQQGVKAEGVAIHGQPVDVLVRLAKERNAALMIVGRTSSRSNWMFGTVTSAIAQVAPVPVVIVP